MYSHQEIQIASSNYLQDYLLQPILHTTDLIPICNRLVILMESFDNCDERKAEAEQLHFLSERLVEIFSVKNRIYKILNSEPNLQTFEPELHFFFNFFNGLPKELIHKILHELPFYEQLSLMTVSKQANKIINEMPIHDRFIFIKDVYMISMDQLNPEYDLAILTEELADIKPRTIYLSEENGKLAYTVIPFNKSKFVQNITTSLDAPEIFSIETLQTLKDNILKITVENNHTQQKTKSLWTYKELRKLDLLKNLLNTDDTLVVTYANEVQVVTRSKFPWMIRSPMGMMMLWCLCTFFFMFPMAIAEGKTFRYMNSTHNFTKLERDLLYYGGTGLFFGTTMLSGLLSFLCIFLLREKYVETNINNARSEARQLFGFFNNGSSDEESSQLVEIEELKDEQCIITFSSEDEEEPLIMDKSSYLGNCDI